MSALSANKKIAYHVSTTLNLVISVIECSTVMKTSNVRNVTMEDCAWSAISLEVARNAYQDIGLQVWVK